VTPLIKTPPTRRSGMRGCVEVDSPKLNNKPGLQPYLSLSHPLPSPLEMSNKSACIARLGAKASTNRHGYLQQAKDTGAKIVDFLHKNIERLADEGCGRRLHGG